MNENINLNFRTSMSNVSRGISSLQASMRTLDGRVSSLNTSVSRATRNMNGMRGGLRNINTDANRASSSFNNLNSSLNRLNFGLNTFILTRAAQGFANMITSAMDSIEVINMFEVSMGALTEETDLFLQNISSVSGLDLTNLRQATGTFNILARSMGLTADIAKTLGVNATQMSLDMASLFNVPVKQAMADLKSGLVGQTETMYKYGVDITEASLKTEALRLGMEKSVRTMTQGEKMYLRMSLMMRQLTPSVGDLARTIEQPANQLRILGERLITLGRNIGSLFLNTFGAILPYINAVVLALNVLIQTLLGLFGITQDVPKNVADPFSGVANGAEEAEGSVDKLKKTMKSFSTGFDELNVINTTPTSAGGGAGLGLGGASLLPDLSEYDLKLGQIRDKASKIAEKILEWLGFTVSVDEKTGKWNIKLKEGYTNLEKIRDIALLVAAALLTWKLVGFLGSLAPIITKLGEVWTMLRKCGMGMTLSAMFPWLANFASKIGTTVPILLGWSGVIAVAAARFYYLWQTSEKFRKGVERIGEILGIIWKAINENVLQLMIGYFKTLAEKALEMLPQPVQDAIIKFFEGFMKIVGDLDLDFGDFLITLGGIGLLFTPAAPFGIALLGIEALSVLIRAIGGISEESFDEFKTNLETKMNKGIESAKKLFTKEYWVELLKGVPAGFEEMWKNFQIWWENTALAGWIDKKVKPWFTKDKWIEIFKGIRTGLEETFKHGINAVITMVNQFIGWLNDHLKFEWDDFEIGGETLFKGGSIQLVTVPKIPFLARGGMLDGGTPFVAGDGGMAEAIGSYQGKTTVMPLENTDFVNAMYDAIYNAVTDAQSAGGGQLIENVLNLDGEVIYRNQQKVSNRKGVNFNVGSFAR